MEKDSKFSRVLAFTIVVFLLFVGGGAFLLLQSVSVSASGTAGLPNGVTARINGPFDCTCGINTTEIDAGGHQFVFSPTSISIDGTTVAKLDASVEDVQIDASFWSASLLINGTEVRKAR